MSSEINQSEEVRQIVARHIEIIEWHGETADCVCPGDHLHSPGVAEYATAFLAGRQPFIACFQVSCALARTEANRALRGDLGEYLRAHRIKIKAAAEAHEEKKFRCYLQALEERARLRLLPPIRKEAPMALSVWEEASPFPVLDVPVKDHWKLLLTGLYARDAVALDEARCPGMKWANGDFLGNPRFLPLLWVGAPNDVGLDSFETVPTWLERRTCPGPQMCPAEFAIRFGKHFGSQMRRADENVSRRDYLVIRSDDLPLEVFGNVVMFVAESMKLGLRAIVYSGTSIDAWFDYNYLKFIRLQRTGLAQPEHRQAAASLTGLGCDPKMFEPASTARMPGCEHLDAAGNPTGRWQRLVYLDPKFPIDNV